MSSKYRWREKITVVTTENNTYSSAKVYHTIKLDKTSQNKTSQRGKRYPLWTDIKSYETLQINSSQ